MNIKSIHGTKIKYCNLDAGYDRDSELGKKYLIENEIYTVDYIEINSWATDVMLIEYPRIRFNSVLFEDFLEIEEQKPNNPNTFEIADDGITILERGVSLSLQEIIDKLNSFEEKMCIMEIWLKGRKN